MILESLLPALIPVATDGIRSLVNKFTGGAGAAPANVTEVIELMQAETARMQALATIDQAGNVSQWVANVRALQRPIAVVLVISGYLGSMYMPVSVDTSAQLASYAQMATFYLFGDRTYMYFKKRG